MRQRIRQLAAEESGFTLVEVLMVSVLMIVVLGATLSALESFERNARVNDQHVEAQDQARRSLDLMARDLRNLASPIRERPEAVDRALPFDLIFQSEGGEMPAGSLNVRNTERIRYCLDAEGQLWRSHQTWLTATVPNAPAATACPGSGWNRTAIVAQDVVNGEARPIFVYNAGTLQDITEVSSTLWVDVNPGARPSETTLQSSVYLRNQNRKPEADFSVDVVNGTVVLNASETTDPEEKAMTYTWKIDNVFVGNGILLTKPVSAGNHTAKLEVSDGVLTDEATEAFCVPAPAQGVTC